MIDECMGCLMQENKSSVQRGEGIMIFPFQTCLEAFTQCKKTLAGFVYGELNSCLSKFHGILVTKLSAMKIENDNIEIDK